MDRRISLRIGLGVVALLSLGGILRMHQRSATSSAPSRSSPSPTATAAPTGAVPQADSAAQKTQAFREQQDALLRSELSPLARVDYVHLPPGEHTLSSERGALLSLPTEALLPYQGRVRFAVSPQGALSLHAEPAVKLDGTLTTEAALRKGQVIALGLWRFLVSGSEADPALAIYDLGSPARRAYSGLHYFPSDDRYRVPAQLRRYAQPRTVRLAASRGEDKELSAIGSLHFTLPGPVAESMEAYLEQAGSKRLFLIFRDALSGKPGGSYGAGRFLYAELGSDDTVWLDFNQAWNPLCAYSPYFHCPLPPRENWLKSAVPVGEAIYAEH